MRVLWRRFGKALQERLPASREAQWRARILLGFFAFQIVINLLLLPAVLIGETQGVFWLIVLSELTYGGLFLLVWVWRAWRLSSALTVITVMSIVVVGMFIKPGLQPSSVAVLMLFIVIATMLIGRWGAILTGVIAAVAIVVDSGLLWSETFLDGDAITDTVVSAVLPLLVAALMGVMERAQVAGFRDLERALKQAESGARAKDTFLATMSHEIRTPLNGVLGLAQVLSHTPLDDDQQELVSTLRSSGEALQHVLNDVLDYSRLEAGQLSLESLPFSPATLLQESVALFAAHAGARGLTMHCQVAPMVPPLLTGDAFRLRQVLLNLIGNAVKFTEAGTITVAARYEAGRLRLSVQDTGIGIDPDRIALLFQPFAQAESSTTRRFGGSGLGLAICHRLVHAMSGQISAVSVPGEGTCFTVSVPLSESRAALPGAAGTASVRSLSGRVLVAEDNVINQLVLARFLRRWGLEVTLAGDGLEALEAVSQQPFALILMDQFMPRLDGQGAVQQIRARGGWMGTVPIIACTASVTPEDRAACLAAGMDDIIAKPIDENDLFAVLARYLGQEAVRAAHE